MRDFQNAATSAFLAFTVWMATVNPFQADTGTVRVLFGYAGVSREDVSVRGCRCESWSHAGANRQ